ncbi:MAG: prenyltransferase [Halanaerobiales bacterium]
MYLFNNKKYGRIRDWLEIWRPFSWTATIIPVLLAGVVAGNSGRFSWAVFLPILVGVLLVQGAANIVNEYYDYKNGIDKPGQARPSTVLAEDRINSEVALKTARFIMVVFLLTAFIYSIVLNNWYLLIFALLGVGGAYYYTAPPLELKYWGLGLLSVFLFFGLLLSQAVHVALTGAMNNIVYWLVLPVALLISAILHGNDLRDIKRERKIVTIAGKLGLKRGVFLYLLLIFIPYLLVFISVVLGIVSYWGLIVFVTFPLAVSGAKKSLRGLKGDWEKLAGLDVESAKLNILFGCCWLLALFIT